MVLLLLDFPTHLLRSAGTLYLPQVLGWSSSGHQTSTSQVSLRLKVLTGLASRMCSTESLGAIEGLDGFR